MEKGFIKIPKELLGMSLSSDARFLYALILDRTSLSKANGWKDKEGKTYVYFSGAEIMKTMRCCRDKATKMLKELEKENFIKRKKQGLGKPDMIYVCKNKGFCDTENKDTENMKNSSPDSGKTDTNNTYDNNTYINHTDNNLSYPFGETEWIRYEKIIKHNISYENAVVQYGRVWVDEMVSIMLDTVMSPKEYIKINGISYPREVVKSRFLKINDMHLGYIKDSLSRNKTKVRNIRAFLITTLFRAPETMENYYTARVNYDLNN